MPARRIGVTMRGQCAATGEMRDALARDWPVFLDRVLPEAAWMPIPNNPDAVRGLFDRWELDGLILTGGNDLGQDAQRDATERAALKLALQRGLPVLGVCRGLQFVQNFFGGRVVEVDRAAHVAARHAVRMNENGTDRAIEVNSFHGFGVREADLAPELAPLALSADGCVEAARGTSQLVGRVLCLQWHPEREKNVNETDRRLIRSLFGWE